MRTTVRIDDNLLEEAKRLAANAKTSLGQFVEDAIRETIARRKAHAERPRVSLPTFRGGGLQPGVDLDGNAALLDLLDADDDASDCRQHPDLRLSG